MIFTLQIATSVFAETLENLQHSTQPIPESLSYTITPASQEAQIKHKFSQKRLFVQEIGLVET
jgi:hypothetical protein